jgi:hypothetical protein
MFGIDLVLWGVILAAVAIPVAIAVPVVLYFREGHAKIKVSGEFDKTGFVELVIAKTGRGEAQIDSVELMRADTNTKLPLIARSKTGPIEFAGGKAKVRVYFKLVGESNKDDRVEALVGHGAKPLRVKITWTTRNIVPHAGTAMIDVRDPIPPAADTSVGGTDKTAAPAAQSTATESETSETQTRTADPKKDEREPEA